MDWIYMAKNGNNLRAVVDAVMNFHFHKMLEISSPSENL
jgi:hypothetical protein